MEKPRRKNKVLLRNWTRQLALPPVPNRRSRAVCVRSIVIFIIIDYSRGISGGRFFQRCAGVIGRAECAKAYINEDKRGRAVLPASSGFLFEQMLPCFYLGRSAFSATAPKNAELSTLSPTPTVPRHKANAIRRQLWMPVPGQRRRHSDPR